MKHEVHVLGKKKNNVLPKNNEKQTHFLNSIF